MLIRSLLLISTLLIRLLTRFVPQANRSLHTFNLHLNMHTHPRPSSWTSWIPLRRPGPDFRATEPHTSTTGQSRRPENAHMRNESRTFHISNSQSVPPARNERGEILLSSRVDTEFREGYERYRNAFERKRREKLEAQRRDQPSSIWSLLPFHNGPASTSTDAKVPRAKTS